jgi:hypothetical protein
MLITRNRLSWTRMGRRASAFARQSCALKEPQFWQTNRANLPAPIRRVCLPQRGSFSRLRGCRTCPSSNCPPERHPSLETHPRTCRPSPTGCGTRRPSSWLLHARTTFSSHAFREPRLVAPRSPAKKFAWCMSAGPPSSPTAITRPKSGRSPTRQVERGASRAVDRRTDNQSNKRHFRRDRPHS